MRRKASVMVTVLLVSGLLVFASVASAQESAPAPKPHSMTGCLQKGMAPNTFQLTNLEKGPKTVEIVETTAKLDPHVGHKVEVTGTAVPSKEQGAHSMKITEVKMISATCP